jgi:hypothetical protein
MALTSPTLLLRANDGATYAFPILITVTPGLGEMIGGRFPIVFRDSVIGTAFDWASMNIPPTRVGEQLTFIPTFRVGCTNSPTPEIFGPLGTFNNDADTAEFLFPTQRVFTGAIKIECLLRDPNMPGPGPRPENRDIEDLPIPTPMPDDPGRNDLIQDHPVQCGLRRDSDCRSART